jgi:hypothetical protein
MRRALECRRAFSVERIARRRTPRPLREARRRNKAHFARTARREEAARVPGFGAEIAPEGPARGRRTSSNPAFSCARRIAASVGRANPRRAPIVYATDSSS